MPRWNGGVIGAANNPTTSSAKGIWSLSEATKAIRAGLWPPSNAGADPYFEYVTMLLPGDGTNGAQNNTFLDSSTNNFTITRNGNTTQGTFTPFSEVDGRWGNFFDGVDDYISAPSVSLGTGNFTFEAWQYILPDGSDYGRICGMGDFFNSTGLGINFNPSTSKFEVNNNNSAIITSSSTYSFNTWHHVALVRSGSTVTLYVNGTSAGTATNSNSLSGIVYVSAIRYNGTNFFGASYTSNFRLTNTAVYTGAFTPSTAPLTAISGTQVLTCQSNRFIDNSTNAYAITIGGAPSIQTFSPFPTLTAYASGTNGGSGYFDGTGDFLNYTQTGGVGNGDFTLEFWLYPTAIGDAIRAVWDSRGSDSGTDGFFLGSDTSNFYLYTGGAKQITATTPSANTWTHVALVRSGNDHRLYFNGTQVGSTYTAANNYSSTGAYISRYFSSGLYFTSGYLSSMRLVKGTAVYTAAFTTPTAPLTAITNTSLLCNFTNGGIIDNAMSNDLETVGNASISTTQSKFGGSSMYFDGTGDRLLGPTGEATKFGGDFTVECWIYISSLPSLNAGSVIFASQTTHANSTGIMFGPYSNAGAIGVFTNNAWATYSSNPISANSWWHIAMVRSGSTISIYTNGTLTGSFTNSTNFSDGGLIIGDGRSFGNAFTGYIDDLRITKGYARYTANFTAPAAPFVTFGD